MCYVFWLSEKSSLVDLHCKTCRSPCSVLRPSFSVPQISPVSFLEWTIVVIAPIFFCFLFCSVVFYFLFFLYILILRTNRRSSSGLRFTPLLFPHSSFDTCTSTRTKSKSLLARDIFLLKFMFHLYKGKYVANWTVIKGGLSFRYISSMLQMIVIVPI